MSDIKASNLSSLVSKKTRRAKERLLQNFGKADRTTDELFESHLLSFNKQYNTALNLQKQVKNYMHCLKEFHAASESLSNCLMEMHEKEWPKHDALLDRSSESFEINEDLEDRLKGGVVEPLEQYLSQFVEKREKIAKRGRKLVDYDSQRHAFDTLKQNQVGKQSDEVKVAEQRELLEQSKLIYETLNKELNEELPELYDNRIPFVASVFQRLSYSHKIYHNDYLGVHKNYLEIIDALAKALEKNSLSSVRSSADQVQSSANDTNALNSNQVNEAGNPFSEGTNEPSNINSDSAPKEAIEEVSKEPVHLHKVKTTYKYSAEDADELSFEAGEIIQVIEYDDPADQEEGWLMGIKESDGSKGLFPANFTKELKT